jgi:nucleoside 2-deoxyribosyltransferase
VILDGRTVDEGAAFEMGYAHALGRPCVGLQTDPRRLLPIGNNPMLDGALQHIFKDVNEVIAWVEEPSRLTLTPHDFEKRGTRIAEVLRTH